MIMKVSAEISVGCGHNFRWRDCEVTLKIIAYMMLFISESF